jgi:glycosyltransferase involved in cell wall biosynthesis
MKRVIFVSLDFYPDDQAVSQLFVDLLLRLAGERFAITVLCGFPMGTSTGHSDRVPRYETVHGIEIIRCGFPVQDKRRLLLRAILYASFLVHAWWKLVGLGRNSLVFGVTSPPFNAQLLWAASWIGRFRYQYMFLDIYPEALCALGCLDSRSLLARGWRFFNRLSYRRASALVVLGRDMIPLLARQYSIHPDRVTYIPHWSVVEGEEPIPFSANRLAGRLGIQDKFVVQYSGNMGLLHDMETLVRAAHRLRDDDQIHFLFIGKGRRRRAAETLARELDLPNVTWLEFVPRAQLHEALSCCHAALISLRRGMEGVAVPSKLYGILASGRTVLAQVPRESEIAYVVEEEQCGLVVEPDDTEGLAQAIQRLASNPELTRELSANARRAYASKYTLQQAVDAFDKLWDRGGVLPSADSYGRFAPRVATEN